MLRLQLINTTLQLTPPHAKGGAEGEAGIGTKGGVAWRERVATGDTASVSDEIVRSGILSHIIHPTIVCATSIPSPTHLSLLRD